MPQYYGGMQGPAQYAMHQQSRQDQQMQNMLRMLMQLRSLKQDRTQWEQGQSMKQQQFALDKEKFKSVDQGRKAYEKYQEHLMKPTPVKKETPWDVEVARSLYEYEEKEKIKDKYKDKTDGTKKPPTGQTVLINKVGQNITRQISRVAKKSGAKAVPDVFGEGFTFQMPEGQAESPLIGFLQGAKSLVTGWINTTSERSLNQAEMQKVRQANMFLSNLHKYEADIEKFLSDPTVSPEYKTPQFIFEEYLNYANK